jgi:hypothetical protein
MMFIPKFSNPKLVLRIMLGYSMNIAAKITSITAANKVSIGDNVYKSLDRKVQRIPRVIKVW